MNEGAGQSAGSAKGLWCERARYIFILVGFLLIPLTPSLAQDNLPAASRACRRQCDTQVPAQSLRAQPQRELQACLISLHGGRATSGAAAPGGLTGGNRQRRIAQPRRRRQCAATRAA